MPEKKPKLCSVQGCGGEATHSFQRKKSPVFCIIHTRELRAAGHGLRRLGAKWAKQKPNVALRLYPPIQAEVDKLEAYSKARKLAFKLCWFINDTLGEKFGIPTWELEKYKHATPAKLRRKQRIEWLRQAYRENRRRMKLEKSDSANNASSAEQAPPAEPSCAPSAEPRNSSPLSQEPIENCSGSTIGE